MRGPQPQNRPYAVTQILDRLAHMGDHLSRAIDVGIIGGGYAGMAAAVTLADAGFEPTVMEAAATLGGRARRVDWHGHRLDNGQHLLLGAYRQTLALHARVGGTTQSFHRIPFTLEIDSCRLRSVRLPAPLNLGAGLIAARGLNWRHRCEVVRFVTAVLRGALPAEEDTVAAWLGRSKQSNHVVATLWGPLCLAALNTPPAEASARLFANVLRAALATTADSDFIVPREDLSAFFPERAAAYVGFRGGDVQLRSRVDSLQLHGTHIETQSRSSRRFDFVICATAPHQAQRLLRPHPRLASTSQVLARLGTQSIITLYLQFASAVDLGAPIRGATKGFDWIFDRAWSHGNAGLFAVVISGANERMGATQTEVLNGVLERLQKRIALPRLQWAKMIRERHATIAAVAGLKRPDTSTGHPRLFLAGDYLKNPYPATIESAVTSGQAAARSVIAAASNQAC